MQAKTPKYQMIVEWIKQQVQDGAVKEGDKFFSEHELGEKFEVSRQTVRQAISVAERDGYLESRRGSGTYVVYTPEKQPAQTMTIGVISTYLDDYIFPPIIRGIGKALGKRGYTMQLVFTLNRVENETKALQNMLQRGVDGLLVEPTKSGLPNPNLEMYKRIAAKDIPIVFFNAYYPSLPFAHVALNDKAAGKAATQRLIKAGHRKIAGLFQSDDIQGHLRYAGYLEALIENGIDMNAKRVLWFATEDIPTLYEDEKRVLDRLSGATAVLCYNDQVGVELLEFLKAQGKRVPQDISVISIDNAALAQHSTPPLTTINHPKEILGKMAAENLLKKIETPSFDANWDFEPKIVERDSIAKIKG